jgi:hypothetical protein
MSLTTAISDEEDIESNRASPYKVNTWLKSFRWFNLGFLGLGLLKGFLT